MSTRNKGVPGLAHNGGPPTSKPGSLDSINSAAEQQPQITYDMVDPIIPVHICEIASEKQ